MPSTPLPKTTSEEVQHLAHDDPDSLAAYNTCLHFEQLSIMQDAPRFARILGYLLLYAPNRVVRDQVVKCILDLSAVGESYSFIELGAIFERNVIVPFMKYKSRTPTMSEQDTLTPSSEIMKKEIEVAAVEVPKDHQDAKRRALVRDNWRCVVTGLLHEDAPPDILNACDPQEVTVSTQCAHIIPEALFFNVGSKGDKNLKLDYSTSILAILEQFVSDANIFNMENVHSLTNVMTLQSDIHTAFNRQQLYFEAMPDEQNHYQIKSFKRTLTNAHQRHSLTFSSPNPKLLPVPSPALLALHATCCKVAHLSGSAEYIDTIYDDDY